MGSFAAPLLLGGLSAIGGLFGSKKQTSDTNSSSTTTPNYDPTSLALKNFLLNQYQTSVNNIPSWNTAYENTGLKNILASSQGSEQAAQDALAARGISRTTAGANSIADQSYQRGKNVSSFLSNAPIVEQQNLLSTLGGAGSFLASLPVGTTVNGTSHTTGTTGPTSPIAGFLGGGAQGLATVLGQQSANNSLTNILKNLNLKPNGTGSTTGAVNSDDWGG